MAGGTTPDKSAVPRFVGRYEVLLPIASGGMATVYLARARGAAGFERDVALKVTHVHLRESPEFQSLLVEEAKLVSAIRHNNIVSVLDVGDDPLGLFLVMEYVEGDTLGGLLRKARANKETVPQRIAFRVVLDALAGLHAAHEAKDADGQPLSVVHRDFSPQNILVGTDGIAKLTDFGIAKAASRVGHTSTGVVKGKVAYMAPEQARGVPIDRRADVWAAGVVAWEIIAGRPLWPRDTEDVATLIKLVTTQPPRLSEIVPTVSPELDAAVAKALTVDPAQRWDTAAALAKAIAAAVDVADTEQTAEYVRTVAGPKIAQRREQVRAMAEVRAKISSIAEASIVTPSSHLRAALSPETAGELTQIDASPLALLPSERPPAERSATTDTTSSTDASSKAPRATRKRLLVAGASVGGVLLLSAVVWGVAGHRSTESSGASQPPAVATETPAVVPAPSQTPTAASPRAPAMSATMPNVPAPFAVPTHTPTRNVVTSTPTANPTTTGTAAASPVATTTVAHTAAIHAAPHATPATGSKLAPSPY